MELSVARHGGGRELVLHLAGGLDVSASASLRRAVPITTPARLVLYLGGVTFIDSAGLRALIECHLRQQHGGGLVLRGATEPVLRFFELCGLDDYFRTEEAG